MDTQEEAALKSPATAAKATAGRKGRTDSDSKSK